MEEKKPDAVQAADERAVKQDSSEGTLKVKVALRIRPLIPRDMTSDYRICLQADPEHSKVVLV
jgi:hypothetical protein